MATISEFRVFLVSFYKAYIANIAWSMYIFRQDIYIYICVCDCLQNVYIWYLFFFHSVYIGKGCKRKNLTHYICILYWYCKISIKWKHGCVGYVRVIATLNVYFSIHTLGTLMTSAAADVINHNGRKIARFKPRLFCYVNMHISAWIFA